MGTADAPSPVRVVIADDAATARLSLKAAVEADGTLVVVGEARDGAEAVELCVRLRPDVALLDVRMPVMDGVSATKEIMARAPLPVVVISGTQLDEDPQISFVALAAGAVEVVRKPRAGIEGQRADDAGRLRRLLRLMSEVKVVRRGSLPPEGVPAAVPARSADLLAIGASTGGPAALARLLRDIRPPLPLPAVVVQHIMEGFVSTMTSWLSSTTGHDVRVASAGEVLTAGAVLVAPDDFHMTVERGGRIRLGRGSPIGGHRPSVNELFHSVARVHGHRAIGVLLTGMGDDGAQGLGAMHQAGALTFAEAEASCAVYGMPRAAVELGAVDHLLPLGRLARELGAALSARPPQPAP